MFRNRTKLERILITVCITLFILLVISCAASAPEIMAQGSGKFTPVLLSTGPYDEWRSFSIWEIKGLICIVYERKNFTGSDTEISASQSCGYWNSIK